MKRILALALALFASQAFATTIPSRKNRVSGIDDCQYLNIGGTPTTLFCLSATSGAATIGPAGLTADAQNLIQSGATGSNYVLKVFNNRTDGAGNGLFIDTSSVLGSNNFPFKVSTNAIEKFSVREDGATTITGTGGNVAHGCVVRSTTSTTSAPTQACSAGEIAISGGCDPVSGTSLYSTFPTGGSTSTPPTGWKCFYSTSVSVAIYAVCCSY